jgi:hypothetical protein
MSRYVFKIRQGEHSKPSITSDCPDDASAQREAAGMFADMARDIADFLQLGSNWQIEVVDEAGETFFRLSVLAEHLK